MLTSRNIDILSGNLETDAEGLFIVFRRDTANEFLNSDFLANSN